MRTKICVWNTYNAKKYSKYHILKVFSDEIQPASSKFKELQHAYVGIVINDQCAVMIVCIDFTINLKYWINIRKLIIVITILHVSM